MLLCPVRECQLPLATEGRSLRCTKGHSFDRARSGYINLLQPQDRRSKLPGDTAAAVAARRRLHDLGITRPLLQGLLAFSGATAQDTVLDAGCGEGFYLGTMAEQTGLRGFGIDISSPAIEAAAKRYPSCTWLIANADRFLPLADRTCSLVLSITARRNPPEFQRILQPSGRLLVAIPAPDDLIELRGTGRDRTASTVAEFADRFTLLKQHRVSTTAALDAASVDDIRHSIYRPMQAEPARAMQVTFSLDLLLLQPIA